MAYKNKLCGVYRIYCVKSKRSYIGSSVDIKGRFTWHKFILRHNSPEIGYGLSREHPCQEDWNIFGSDSFLFEILALREPSERLILEQTYMDLHEYLDRYNFDVKANGSKKLSEETKRRMSEMAKIRNMEPKYNKMISDRAKRQHAEFNLGVHTWKR